MAVARSRRSVLAVLLFGVAVLTAAVLADVIATVFFAVTVAYVLVPLWEWLRRRGLPPWWASAVATTFAFVSVVVLSLPIAVILYLRRRSLLALLRSLPDQFSLEVAGFVYAVDAGEVTDFAARTLTRTAIEIARAAPVLAAKATVFAFVVFALLLRRDRVRKAILGPISPDYHDVVQSVHRRVRDTLYALYVIQAVTAIGTFVVALVVFFVLGYQFPVALAVVAAVLQFFPVVGPSLLVLGIAVFEASAGAFGRAALVFVSGLVLIGFLPDAVLRPRLARETAGLPASLYFVGFTGGILSLGAVGIIAGPLIVAVLVEVFGLLAVETNQTSLRDFQP